jgi:DNA polymerase-3 subunit alpha
MLIRVGALDDFAERHILLAIIDRLVNLSSSTHKASSVGQMSMFDFGDFDTPQLGTVLRPVPEDAEPIPQKERLAWEKELAGTYLSSHPMQKYIDQIAAAGTTPLMDVAESMHGQVVTVAGLINYVRPHQTKKGASMAFVEIEDLQASREVLIFPKLYSTAKNLLKAGSLIVVRGRVDAPEGRQPKVLADTITNEIVVYSAVKKDPARPATPATGDMPLFVQPPQIDEGDSPPPAASQPKSPEAAASKAPQINGHGDGRNGHQITPAVGATEPADEAATSDFPSNEGRQLHITLPLTGNLTDDKHRLKTVFDVLTETPGKDAFSIYIATGNQSPVRIDFPNHSTHYTARLQQRLTLILGARSVRLEN